MDNFSNTLIVLFTLLNIWLIWQLYVQIKKIKLSAMYFNIYRIFLIVGLVVCLLMISVDFSNHDDMILSYMMTLLMLLLLCQRDGIGKFGVITKGVYILYEDIIYYDIKKDEKAVHLMIRYKESARKDKVENNADIKFDISKEKELLTYLSTYLKHKNTKRRKK